MSGTRNYGPPPAGYQDHIVKNEHGVQLPVRVWPSKNSSQDRPAPWLLYIHGGGWQGGQGLIVQRWIYEAFKDYHVVSAQYRLIPHVSLAEQVKDVVDTAAWVKANLPKYVDGVDFDAYAVAGDSAGGTLSLLTALELSPAPRAVVDLYGVTDMADPHFSKRAELDAGTLGLTPEREEQIKTWLADRDPSHARTARPWRWEVPPALDDGVLQTFWGKPDYKVDEDDLVHLDAYDYLAATRTRMEVLFRKQETDEAGLDTHAEYPPTFILHGTGDDIVPLSHGTRLEAKLKELGGPVASAYPKGKGHAFDQTVHDPESADWKFSLDPLLAFVDKHVRGL